VLRAAQLYVIETARANKHTLLDIARVSTPPLTSQLEEWVNRVIGILVLLLLTVPVPPNGVPEGIQRAIKQLK